MGFKRIISFDHLSSGLLNSGATDSYAGMAIVGNNYGNWPAVTQDTDGKKKIFNAGLYSAIAIRFNNIGLDFSKKIIIGYRHRPENPNVWGFSLSMGIGTGGGGIAYTCSEWGQTTEAYIEVVFDFIANTIAIYMDGVLVKTYPQTAAAMTAHVSTYGWLTFAGNNSSYSSWVSDIYFRDQVGSEVIAPVGGVSLIPLTLDATTGTSWVPTAGQTLSETLNAVSSTATPVVTNPGTSPVAPIVSNMRLSGPNDHVVLAVSFIASAFDSVAPAKTITGALTLDGQTKTGDSILLTSTMQQGKRISMFEKAPDGSNITLGKLKAGTVTATFT